MSPIPTSLTEMQFDAYVRPYLSTAQRGYVSKIALYKIFNYMLYRLHTGCQWEQVPIDRDPDNPEKKKSVTTPCTIIFASGAVMAASKSYGKPAL